jgi:hypothetical protein
LVPDGGGADVVWAEATATGLPEAAALAAGVPLPPVEALATAVEPPEVVLAAAEVDVELFDPPPQAAIKGDTMPATERAPKLRKSVRRDTRRRSNPIIIRLLTGV